MRHENLLLKIFDLRHYRFLKTYTFLHAMLSDNCLLFGADNVYGQISEHIFRSNVMRKTTGKNAKIELTRGCI